MAVEHNHSNKAKPLVQSESTVSASMMTNELHQALDRKEDADYVLHLLSIDDFRTESMAQEEDSRGRLPLHRVLAEFSSTWDKYHMRQIVTLLLTVYEESVTRLDADGCLPLHHAARMSSFVPEGIFELILNRYPDGALCQNTKEELPIHLTRDDCRFEILMEMFPDTLHVPNRDGVLPLVNYLEQHALAKCRSGIVNKACQLLGASCHEEIELEKKKTAKYKDYFERLQDMCHDEFYELYKTQIELAEDNIDMQECLATMECRLALEASKMQQYRTFEKAFLASVKRNQTATSIHTLKSFARSLKARLDETKASLHHDAIESSLDHPSLIQVMFDSFIENPRVSKSTVLDLIVRLDQELSILEEEQTKQQQHYHHDGNHHHQHDSAVAVTQDLEYDLVVIDDDDEEESSSGVDGGVEDFGDEEEEAELSLSYDNDDELEDGDYYKTTTPTTLDGKKRRRVTFSPPNHRGMALMH